MSLASAAGCSQNPADVRDYRLKRGDAFVAAGKTSEAIIEFKAAVQADGKSGPAHQKLAAAYLQVNDFQNGFSEYVRAADLLPDNLEAQLQAAGVLLMAGQFEDAQARAEKALRIDPKNVPARIVKGNALAGLKRLDLAITEVESAIQTDPKYGLSYTSLGALQRANGDTTTAEATFKRAIQTDPTKAGPHLALANLYWAMGKRVDAENAFLSAVKAEPRDLMANRALATFYLSSGRTADAEAPLKTLAADSPDFGSLTLADYYSRTGRIAEARVVLRKLADRPDTAAVANLRLASLLLYERDQPGAKKLVDDVLRSNPTHGEALVARAKLEVLEGGLDTAAATLRSAITSNPSLADAHFVLGNIQAVKHQSEDAIASYREALRVNPSFAPAMIELARQLMASKPQEAVLYARSASRALPNYAEGILILARAELASGNPKGAEEPLKRLAAAFPKAFDVQAELGRMLQGLGRTTEARAAFERALAGDPSQVTALTALTLSDLEQKKTAAARARVDAAAAAAPKNAALQIGVGRLYAAMGDNAAAEKSARSALASDANNLEAYELLALVFIKQNRIPEATTEFERLAEKQPKSVANQTSVGMLYQIQGKFDQAKAAYERALTLDARAPVVANNLAQLYVDRNENLEVALQLAQTAKAGLPNTHQVDDTLGWICYKKGLAAQAVSSMKAAVNAQPENAVYLYHLGAAYALNKDKANARQALEKALKLQPNFQGADDARKILTSLN